MRLRKNMKRTAAAVLALSMAVSAVAAPASAAYICDVSQGNVVVSVDSSGNKTIKVGDDSVTIKTDGTKETTGNGIKEDGDGTEDIVITGDNTKPAATESLNAAEENADEAENADKNTSEVEKPGEAGKSGEGEDDEPTSQELLAPEDEEKKDEQKDEQKPAETQETEQDKKPTDKVLLCGQNDPEADKEATKQETKEKSYEDTPAPTSLSESVQAAANNVVKIINNSASVLKVILRDLKVDAGTTDKDAMTISGKGDVTLELDGDTELKGGSTHKKDKDAGAYRGGHGLNSESMNGVLTIQDENKEKGTLTATGGSVEANNLSSSRDYESLKGGAGINASSLVLSGVKVKAEGGSSTVGASSDVITLGGTGIVTTSMNKKTWDYFANPRSEILNSDVTVKGGDATGKNNMQVNAGDGLALSGNVKIEGSSISATGGSAETTSSYQSAKTGTAMNVSGEKNGYDTYSLSLKESVLNLFGGHAKSKAYSIVSEALYIGGFNKEDKTLENLTITAKEATGEVSNSNGNINSRDTIFGNSSGATIGGDSTIDVIGSKVSGITAGDNTVMNIYVPKGETADVSNAKVSEDGKIYVYDGAKVTENEDGTITADGTISSLKKGSHNYTVASTTEPTCTTPGKRVYTCTTEGHESDTYEETIDALGHEFVNGVCIRCGAPEQAAAEGGGSSAVTLTVTGAEAYETSIADGRYIIAVPAETAVLSGSLGNLKELKAQGVNTLVFRTQLCETVLNIDSMLSLGVDDTLFTLTHSGESAELTVGGVAHNELLH